MQCWPLFINKPMLVLNKPSWCRFFNLINKSSMDGYRGWINNLTLDLEREGKKKE